MSMTNDHARASHAVAVHRAQRIASSAAGPVVQQRTVFEEANFPEHLPSKFCATFRRNIQISLHCRQGGVDRS